MRSIVLKVKIIVTKVIIVIAGGENYCLHLTQFRITRNQLQIDNDFCDVTLECEDEQILSHRIIVSHSSN